MLTGMYWTSLLNNWVRRLLTSNKKSLLLRLPPHFLYKLYEAESLVDELVLCVRDDALLSKDCIDKSSEVDMATSSSFLSISLCSIIELTGTIPQGEVSPFWSSGLNSSEASLWNCWRYKLFIFDFHLYFYLYQANFIKYQFISLPVVGIRGVTGCSGTYLGSYRQDWY